MEMSRYLGMSREVELKLNKEGSSFKMELWMSKCGRKHQLTANKAPDSKISPVPRTVDQPGDPGRAVGDSMAMQLSSQSQLSKKMQSKKCTVVQYFSILNVVSHHEIGGKYINVDDRSFLRFPLQLVIEVTTARVNR